MSQEENFDGYVRDARGVAPNFIVKDNHVIHQPTGLMTELSSREDLDYDTKLRKAIKVLKPVAEQIELGQKVVPNDDDDWTFFKQRKAGAQIQRGQRRDAFGQKALELRWIRHHETHYSRYLDGERVDYWPGPKKWRYKNRTMFGDVHAWLRKRDPEFKALQARVDPKQPRPPKRKA